MRGYDVIESPGVPIKAWTRGVPIEDAALKQLKNVASLPFILSIACKLFAGWASDIVGRRAPFCIVASLGAAQRGVGPRRC